jgi:uncharacterized membrane protein (DUF373 family)
MGDLKYNVLNRIYEAIVFFMAIIMVFLLIGSVTSIVKQIPSVLISGDKQIFDSLVTEVLTFFVLIEIIRAFTEYLEFKRVRLYIMAEVAAIFILRELLIILYAHNFQWENLIAFSILLLSVVTVRTISLMYSPQREKRRG